MRRSWLWVAVAGGLLGCTSEASLGRSAGAGGRGAAGASGAIDNPDGNGGVAGDVSNGQGALTVHVEDPEGLVLEVVTVRCAGECADVVAVASGGHPPYAFEWDDGSTEAARTVCLDASARITVRVTDTAIEAEENAYEARTVTEELPFEVLSCPSDGGVPDAGPCEEDGEPVVIGEVQPDIHSNAPVHFADGAALPAGRYSVEWIDGCLRYDPTIYFWSVNGSFSFRYWIIGETTSDPIEVAPVPEDLFGQATFEACVELSAMAPPTTLDFAGGRLGMFNNDFKFDDNTDGDGGRNPTFRLTRLPGCEQP